MCFTSDALPPDFLQPRLWLVSEYPSYQALMFNKQARNVTLEGPFLPKTKQTLSRLDDFRFYVPSQYLDERRGSVEAF
jgi:hypothetical protein